MDLKNQKDYFIIFIAAFFILNIINTYFLTSQTLNRYISPFKRTFVGEITAVVGNLAILLLFVVIAFIAFKSDRGKLIFLLVVTLLLNFLVFALGIFNLYYGTAFSVNAFEIFKNPAEGLATGIEGEIFRELILYYRILVFVPFIALLLIFSKYNKHFLVTEETQLFLFTWKRFLIGVTGFVVLFSSATISFVTQLRNEDFAVGALISTKGVQNYGVYPFYVMDFLGANFDYTTRKSLKLTDDEDLISAYDTYNKNQNSYTNVIDQKTYSNVLLAKDSVLTEEQREALNLNDEDSLTGVFAGKNLVLVHLESLNYFLWQLEETNERFQFLNQLMAESFVFENYYTSVGMGVSSDAEASVLTGLYMNGYSTFYREYGKTTYEEDTLEGVVDTLPKLFKKAGYKTQAVHSNYEAFYNRAVAYEHLIGFDDYYSLEDFYKDDVDKTLYPTLSDYTKNRVKEGFNYKGIDLNSPWPSDFELADKINELSTLMNNKHMIFSLYMTPHTPFMYNPYENQEYTNIADYNKLKDLTRRYLEYIKYIDDSMKSFFFDIETGESKISSDNVYVFYGDHGSGLKNQDLSKLFGRDISLLEERRMLQQTVAFIYAPSDDVNDKGINKGLLTGTQTLTRGHVDLYRTIGDLFGLFDENDFYFGVHGLSEEPTFVIDNRIQDLIIDDIRKINEKNYAPYITSLRNEKQRYPHEPIQNVDEVLSEIKRFKKLSDLLFADDKVYNVLKKALQKRNQ